MIQYKVRIIFNIDIIYLLKNNNINTIPNQGNSAIVKTVSRMHCKAKYCVVVGDRGGNTYVYAMQHSRILNNNGVFPMSMLSSIMAGGLRLE
jgi:hypothetical protein